MLNLLKMPKVVWPSRIFHWLTTELNTGISLNHMSDLLRFHMLERVLLVAIQMLLVRDSQYSGVKVCSGDVRDRFGKGNDILYSICGQFTSKRSCQYRLLEFCKNGQLLPIDFLQLAA